MGLMDRLKRLGCRLRLIRTVPARTEPPRKITPRVTSIKDLKAQVLERDSVHRQGELSASLENIFDAAGIERRTWNVERLRDMLRTEPYRSMDRAAAGQAILDAMSGQNARIDDLVQDARARGRALDESEGRALALMRERQEARRRQRESLQRQLGELNEACRALDAEDQDDQQALREWQARKSAYEKEIMWALGYLMETPGGVPREPKKS